MNEEGACLDIHGAKLRKSGEGMKGLMEGSQPKREAVLKRAKLTLGKDWFTVCAII
jgi:hypothetical protein